MGHQWQPQAKKGAPSLTPSTIAELTYHCPNIMLYFFLFSSNPYEQGLVKECNFWVTIDRKNDGQACNNSHDNLM